MTLAVVGLLRLNLGLGVLGEGRGRGALPSGVEVLGVIGKGALMGEGFGEVRGAIVAGLGERGGGGRMVGTGRFLRGMALSETGCSSAGRFLLMGSAGSPFKMGSSDLGVLWTNVLGDWVCWDGLVAGDEVLLGMKEDLT